MTDPLATVRGRELDDAGYLRAIETLDFDGARWDEAKLAEMRDFLGPWQHNIRLPHGVFTAYWDKLYPPHEEMMRIVARELRGDFRDKRVLDLGCLEGYFAVESCLQGASVTAVEGRAKNIKKCEFVRSALGIDPARLRLAQDDAMDVTRARFGGFDAILVLGLLYHLADPCAFLANMAELCDGFVLIDTHVALENSRPTARDGWTPELSSVEEVRFRGKSYRGRWYREFDPGASQLEKDLSVAASLSVNAALWLLEDSLVQVLHDVGFAQVAKLSYPHSAETWWSVPEKDARVLYLATKRPEPFESKVFAVGD